MTDTVQRELARCEHALRNKPVVSIASWTIFPPPAVEQRTYTGEQVEAKRGLGEYNRCAAAAAALAAAAAAGSV